MPLVEYQCSKCHATIEVIQKFSDPDLQDCSKCGGTLERLLSVPAIHFKGAGWYVNDYARKGSSGNGASAKPETGDKPSTESKPATEAKPATAAT